MKRLVAAALLALVPATTHATVLTFDDLQPLPIILDPLPPICVTVCTGSSGCREVCIYPPSTIDTVPIPNGYGGLTWANFNYRNGLAGVPSGFTFGIVSGDQVAYNLDGGPAALWGSVMDVQSGFFTAAWRNDLVLDVYGFRSGAPLYGSEFLLNTTTPTFAALNFLGVDAIVFQTSGGTDAGFGTDGTQFVLDNFTFAAVQPVAEPASVSFLFVGLLTLTLARRFRRGHLEDTCRDHTSTSGAGRRSQYRVSMQGLAVRSQRILAAGNRTRLPTTRQCSGARGATAHRPRSSELGRSCKG